MRYITGTSAPATPATDARQVLDMTDPLIWLRMTARGGSVEVIGRGVDSAATDGRQLGYGEQMEVEAPRGGSFKTGDFWATGTGNIDWEAVIL